MALTEDSARHAGSFEAEDVYIDGKGIGDIGNIVLKDRHMLSDNGLVVVVATIDEKNKRVLAGPDIISRGFIYMRESEDLIQEAQKVAFNSIQQSFKNKQMSEHKLKNQLIDSMKNFLYDRTERQPIILPVIMPV